MSALQDMTIPLLPDRYYHIYNRGNAKQPIFFENENYSYFLKKYAEKLDAYVHNYAYCLLINHFHLFIKPVGTSDLIKQASKDFEKVDQGFLKGYVLPWLTRLGWDISSMTLAQLEKEDLTNFSNLLNLYATCGDTQTNRDIHPLDLKSSSFLDQLSSWVLSERMRGFMLGYAKAINKQQNRTGSLFQKGFRRKYVPDLDSEKRLVLSYIHHNPIHHFYTDKFEDYNWSSYKTYLSKLPTKLKREEAIQWFGSSQEFQNFGEQYKSLKKAFHWIIEEE